MSEDPRAGPVEHVHLGGGRQARAKRRFWGVRAESGDPRGARTWALSLPDRGKLLRGIVIRGLMLNHKECGTPRAGCSLAKTPRNTLPIGHFGSRPN